jgi:hypothetical protein
MARDLTRATGKLYKRMSKMQSDSVSASRKLNRSISASKVATRNALKHAKALFASKVVMLSNTVAANLKRNQGDLARVTGVVANIAKANAADRRLIKQQRSAMEADMNKSITRAIQLGEAKAKASAQRIAEYQKGAVKRFLRVELTERLENAADNVFKAVAGRTPSLPRTVSLTTVARRRVPSPPSVTSWPPSVLLTPSRSVPHPASASVVARPPLCSLARRSRRPSPFPRSTVS